MSAKSPPMRSCFTRAAPEMRRIQGVTAAPDLEVTLKVFSTPVM